MLSGKTAVVTGASRGIGRAIAEKLAAEGAFVVINYNGSKEAAETVLAGIRAAGGDGCVMQCNVSDFAACEAWMKEILALYGKIDILVNNAGITKDGLLMGMSEEAFDRVIETNLKGTFNCIRFAARPMIRQKSGCIINMASVVGVAGNAGQANYAASKAGVIGLTKTAARELASRGIRVNAIAPGFIETDMTEVLSDKVKEASVSQIPLGHFGKPEDVANLAAFLASEAAAYITGQVIHCDGGNMHSGEVHLDYPSVGATENILMAAVLLPGISVIHNAAREPEIVDLANFINAMGGSVRGAGSAVMTIEGVKHLHGARWMPMPDRIVAGTLLAAGAITGGTIELTRFRRCWR